LSAVQGTPLPSSEDAREVRQIGTLSFVQLCCGLQQQQGDEEP
jgi:hypothetical protein